MNVMVLLFESIDPFRYISSRSEQVECVIMSFADRSATAFRQDERIFGGAQRLYCVMNDIGCMHVLVTGGDGFDGRHLCSSLAGHDLTVLSRTPDASVLPDEIETVAGDVRSSDSIKSAVAGHDLWSSCDAVTALPAREVTMHAEVHVTGLEISLRPYGAWSE